MDFPDIEEVPMKYADAYGLDKIFNNLREFEKKIQFFGNLQNLLIELVNRGNNFDSLNN